jgi:hypothetical protein
LQLTVNKKAIHQNGWPTSSNVGLPTVAAVTSLIVPVAAPERACPNGRDGKIYSTATIPGTAITERLNFNLHLP